MIKYYCLGIFLLCNTPVRAEVIEINNEKQLYDFVQADGKKPVVIKFSLKGCPPCIRMVSVFERLSKTFENDIIFVAVDARKYSSLANQYNVTSVPVIFFQRPGENQILLAQGFVSYEKMVTILKQHNKK